MGLVQYFSSILRWFAWSQAIYLTSESYILNEIIGKLKFHVIANMSQYMIQLYFEILMLLHISQTVQLHISETYFILHVVCLHLHLIYQSYMHGLYANTMQFSFWQYTSSKIAEYVLKYLRGFGYILEVGHG